MDLYDFVQQRDTPVAETAAKNVTDTNDSPEAIGRRLQIARDNALDEIAHDAEDFWAKEDHYRKARDIFMKNPGVAAWFARNPNAAPLFSGELAAAARVGDQSMRDPDQWKAEGDGLFKLFPSLSPESMAKENTIRLAAQKREEAAREAGDDDYAFTEEEASARALRGMDEQKTVQNAADAVLAADSAAGNSGRYIADNIKQWTDSAINGWRNGADQTELAEINHRVMVEDRDYTPEEEARIKAINDRMKARSDADGAIVFSNAQVLGNMATGLHATDAVHGAVMAGAVAWMTQWALAGAGAGSVVPGAGTVAGAALGAFAGLTVWGAAKLGLVYANAQSTMRQESASNYRTQIEAGVDRDTARAIASGVGLFNSLVEMGLIEKLGGIYSKVTGPLMDRVFRKKVAEGALQFARPTAGAAFKDFAKATGTGLFLYEPGEEVLQEVSQIVGEEVGKRFATDPEKAVPITAEEAASRLWDTYFETVKGVVLLQAAGGVPFLAHNIRRARAAQKNLEFVENVVQYAKESKAAKADKATVESFISSQAEEGHADKIYIEGAKLRQAMRDAGATDAQLAAVDPEAKAQLDRIERDGTGGDVVFDTGKFAVEIAGTDLGMNLKQHIRLAPDALSVAEAVEARKAAGKLVKDQLYWQEHPEEAAKRELDEQGRQVYDEYVEQLTRVNEQLQAANPGRLPMTKEQISTQARLAALSAQSLMASTNLPYETVRRMLPKVRAGNIEAPSAENANAVGTNTLKQEGVPFEKITLETQLGGRSLQEWIASMEVDGKPRDVESAEKIGLLRKLVGAEDRGAVLKVMSDAKREKVDKKCRGWLNGLVSPMLDGPREPIHVAETRLTDGTNITRPGLLRKPDTATVRIVPVPLEVQEEFRKAVASMREGSEGNKTKIRDFSAWAQEILQEGGDLRIASTGQIVSFTNRGIRASFKRARKEEQRLSYLVLRQLIELAEYDHYEPIDARHPNGAGQDVYYSALELNKQFYSVKIKLDVVPSTQKNKGNNLQDVKYKDHKLVEIEIASDLYQTSRPVLPGDHLQQSEATKISLGLLRGHVKVATRLEDGVLLQRDIQTLERSLEQRAYHGSSHVFDKFTLDHIGTGAGAQVHGYGLYFALDRSVADSYRSAVSDSQNPEMRRLKAEEQRALDEKADLARRLQEKRADAENGNKAADAFLRLLGEAGELFGEEDAGLGTDADILAEAGQNNEAEIARLEARIAELDQRLAGIAEKKKAESEKGGRVYEAEIPEDSVMIRELAKFADQPEGVRRGIEAAFREQGLEAPKADDTGRHLYLELQDALGAREASLLLNRHGVKGVRYETPSDGECAVVWDEDSIAIRTELEQGGDASARGLYSPSENVITLTPNADLTTFAHEMSHAYLTQLFNLAAISDKDSRVVKDAQILLKAFGLSSLEEYVELARTPEGFERLRKMQEWWAYQSEMYLSRGTAADPKAAGILKKFGSWVRNVYAQYKGGADGYLNLLFRNEFGEDMMRMSDEVRGVMERMYSSEAAFTRAEAASGLEGFFKQKPEGMDEAMWAAYQEALEASKLEGIEKLQAASLSQMKWLSGARGRILKHFQQQYDAARGVAKDAAEAAVRSLKCMNLLQDMRDGVTAMGGNERLGLKFDRAWLETQNYKPEEIEKLRHLGLVTSEEKGGFPPDALANLLGERFGITTGREMIDLLMTVPDDVPALVKQLTDQYMVQEHAELTDPKWLENQVIEALHSEARMRMVAIELRFFMKATNSRVISQAAKLAAHECLMRTKMPEVKPGNFQRLAARSAANATRLLQQGDMRGAITAKRQQLVNMYMAREALEVEKDRARLEKIRKLAFQGDKKLSASRDMNLVLAVRAILSSYGMAPETEGGPLEYLKPVEQYAPDDYQTLRELVEPHLGVGMPVDVMTAQQMIDLLAAVKAVWDQSRAVKQIEIDKKRVELDDVLAELEREMGRFPADKRGTSAALTAKDKRASDLLSFGTALKRVEHWCARMDGDSPRKPFTRYLYRPIANACTEYRLANMDYVDRYRKLLKPLVKDWAKAPNISGRKFGIEYTFTKFELIGALLHMGNESNFQKLLAGRDKEHPWGEWVELPDGDGRYSGERFTAFVNDCVQRGVLTKADFAFVQGVWDLLEDTKPLAQKAFRKCYGRYFEEIENRPFTIAFPDGSEIKYRGGYVPASTSRLLDTNAERNVELEELSQSGRTWMMPVVQPGFTKSRVPKYSQPLELNPAGLEYHIGSVLRFAYIQPVAAQTLRILNNAQFKDRLHGIDRFAMSDMLMPWLKRACSQSISDGQSSPVLRKINSLRALAGMNMMAGNLANALQQVTGLAISMTLVSPRALAHGLAVYIRNPRKTAQSIAERSRFMRTRYDDRSFEFQSELARYQELKVGPVANFKEWVKNHAYILQQVMQNIVDSITWIGAFDEAMKNPAPGIEGAEAMEAEAVQRADAVIRRTQSSFNPEDIASMEAGSPLKRFFLVFYNYFNMQLNLIGSEGAKALEVKNYGRFAYVIATALWIPSVLADGLYDVLFSGSGDDDDDKEDDAFGLMEALRLIIGAPVRNALNFVPMGGAVTSYFGGQMLKAGVPGTGLIYDPNGYLQDRVISVPGAKLVEDAGKAIATGGKVLEGKGNPVAATRRAFDVLTLISGLPTNWIAKPVAYGVGVESGRFKPKTAGDVAKGLISGRDVNQK